MRNPATSLSFEIQETPLKKRTDSRLEHSHPTTAGFGSDKENDQLGRSRISNDQYGVFSARKDESIYKSLGWDDVDDNDDLA